MEDAQAFFGQPGVGFLEMLFSGPSPDGLPER